MRASGLPVAMWLMFAMPSHANPLEGVWIFQKETNATPAGESVEVPGPPYEGVLIYTADGHVSANLMPKSRTWRVDNAKLEDLRQTVGQGSSTGYAGRYEVDAANRRVTHIPSVSMDPAEKGQRLVRSYLLEGDVLKLSGTWTYEGRNLIFTVHWVRASE